MKTITWVPGSNSDLDKLFDDLREQQYSDKSHRLWKNYSKENFVYAVALTIHFDDHDYPVMCSSIASRDCWPKGAYRILNRLWKHSDKVKYKRTIGPSFGHSMISQLDWLKENTDFNLCFISRQTDHWEDFVIDEFKNRYSVEWKKAQYKYLTCPNECDDTCWQRIIYHGDKELLTQWKHR